MGVLLAAPGAASQQPGAGAASQPTAETRPKLAIVGFEAEAGGDPRDAWLATAFEEGLARRLRRVPQLVVLPPLRAYQVRKEVGEPGGPPWPWLKLARTTRIDYLLTGRCRGPDSAVALELTLTHVGEPRAQPRAEPRRMTLPAGRFFAVLDEATRSVLACLGTGELDEAVAKRVFAPPSQSSSAVEYYAKAVAAVRADRPRDGMRYAKDALTHDPRYRPALGLLAQLEMQAGRAGRASAVRRLRALGALARSNDDPLDRANAELALSTIDHANGAFEAAVTRVATALKLAEQHRDVYAQLAALSRMCDLYVTRVLPASRRLAPDAQHDWAEDNLRQAAEWQTALLERLDAIGSKIAALPAASKLALIYERLGDVDAALALHLRTLKMAQELGSRRHEATAWLYLTQCYRQRQQWNEALDAGQHCLKLADADSQPVVRIALGGVYEAVEAHAEALQQFELAYEQVCKTDDLARQYTCLREIAGLRMRLDRRADAIKALQEATDLAYALELSEVDELRAQLDRWRSGLP